MIDNFDKIKELLKFDNNDQFYFLQILQRKKDHKDTQKVNGTNNNSRLVKAYYIDSLEYYNFIKPEVIQLCDLFNARAGINLNRRSYEKMALQHLKKVTDQIINKSFSKACKAYNSVVGAYNNDSNKTWILDIDDEQISPLMLKHIEYHCQPKMEVDFDKVGIPVSYKNKKIITSLASKNGWHLITKPFNVLDFKKVYPEIEIHKNNPTNLYIP